MKPVPEAERAINTSIKDLFSKSEETPLFLQIDPTRYLYSQRHIASKTEDASAKTEEIQVLLFSRCSSAKFTSVETFEC